MDQPPVLALVLYNLRYFTEHITLNLDYTKIYPNVDDRCDRCKSDKAGLIRMFWSCQKLKNYWTLVFKTLNEAFNLNITPCGDIAIFGVPEHGISLTNNIFASASLLARRILLEWKQNFNVDLWFDIIFKTIEKIKYFKKGSIQNFYQIWESMITYFEKRKTLPYN